MHNGLLITYSNTSNNEIIGTIRDITELKMSLDALKKSEMHYKSLIENSTDVISILDKDGMVQWVSKSHYKVLGFDENDLIGKTGFQIIHPDYIDNIRKLYKILISEPGKTINIIFKIRDANNNWLDVEGTAQNLLNSEYINGVVVNYRNVTERINAQKELQRNEQLLNTISVNFPNSFLTIVNRDMVFEFNSGQEFKNRNENPDDYNGQNIRDIFGDKSEILINHYEKTFDGEEQSFEVFFNDRFYALRTVPLHDNNGVINKILSVAENITNKKKTELALRESEDRFKQLFQQFTDAVFVTKVSGKEKGRIFEVNPAAVKQTGYSAEELLKMNLIEDISDLTTTVIHDDDWEDKLETGQPFTLTEKKTKADGSQYWTEVIVSTINYNGIKAGLSVNRDISARKNIEIKLIENQTILNAILESTGEGIIVLDNNDKISHCNKEFLRMVGYSKDEPNTDIIPLIGLLEKIREPELFLQKNKELSQSPESEKDIIHFTDGKIFERKNYPLIIENKIEGRVWSFNDITENKKTELIKNVIYNISNTSNFSEDLHSHISIIQKELGKIVDTQNMYIALYDHNTNNYSLPFFSDKKNSPDTIKQDSTLLNIVTSRKSPLLVNSETRSRFVPTEKPTNSKEHAKVWLGVPLKEENRSFGVLVLQNYSDQYAFDEYDMNLLEFVSEQISASIHRKSTEEKLKEALLHAEESDMLKSAFLANMSHEIRTPMNGILGFAGLLKNKALTKDQIHKYVNIIEKSGARMLNIINNLIDISKIEAGQMEILISECNINEQLNDLFNFFSVEAKKKGLKLKLNNENKIDNLIINTDCEKLYAILTNLLKNSVKYTNTGHIEFGYIISKQNIEFFIKDTGIGIPEERQEAVFERFIQADIEDKKAFEGAGLGLAISKAYTDMLNGNITLISKENTGSVFNVSIPHNTDIDKLSGHNFDIKDSNALHCNKCNKLKILILEEDEFSIEFLKIILKNIKCKVFEANNDIDAFKILKENPDTGLILMDVIMPPEKSKETVAQIRKIISNVKIIGQTYYILSDEENNQLNNYFNKIISKPVDRNLLINSINSFLKTDKDIGDR